MASHNAVATFGMTDSKLILVPGVTEANKTNKMNHGLPQRDGRQ
jgi:hypothetical protein